MPVTRADRRLAWALAAYLLFIVYGSWVPLNWRAQDLGVAWHAFVALPLPTMGLSARVDVAVNLLLTLPLGFGLAHLLCRGWGSAAHRGPRHAVCALGLWGLLAAFSVGLEFAQMFLPARVASWSDVLAQWVGSCLGLALYRFQGERFSDFVRGWQVLTPGPHGHHPARPWLVLWLAGLLAYSVMPLDLSVMPVELYRKWRDGRVVLGVLPSAQLPVAQWLYGVVSDVLIWAPVGALWRLQGHDGGPGLRTLAWRGLLAAALIEFAQLFVMSRVSDLTDIVLAVAGVSLGAWGLGVLRRWLQRPAAQVRRGLQAAGLVWLSAVLVLLWAPFDFEPARVTVVSLTEVFWRLPFLNYAGQTPFGALGELVRKVLVFLPAGVLWAALVMWSPRGGPAQLAGHGHAPPTGAWRALVGLGLLAWVLEVGQLALPGRTADATDALLAGLGGWLGWRVLQSLASGRAQAPTAAAPPGAVEQPGSRPAPQAPAAAPSAPARAGATPVGLSVLAVLAVLLLALLVWVMGRLPGLPYNLAKLVPAGLPGVASAAAVAVVAWWMLAAPVLLLTPLRAPSGQRADWRRPWARPATVLALVLGHALLSYAVLRAAVPLPMLHKLIGTPVLAWPGAWEDGLRYVALHLSVLLPVAGAAWLVQTVWRPQALAGLVAWGFFSLAMWWPLHWAVVASAGTDNLVELMRGGGSLLGSAALAGALGLGTAAGGALSLALAQTRRRGALLGLALLALVLAPVLLNLGLEPLLVKYERAFSALQFLLSASRERYATGAELVVRALVAGLGFVCIVALVQWPLWRRQAAQALAADS